MNIDPHLAELRRAKSLRLGGMSYRKIGQRMGVTAPTIVKMLDKANELRRAGKLYADMNAQEADIYERPSLPRRQHKLTLNGVSVT